MIATIISLFIASFSTNASSFDGHYNEISYGNVDYSPTAPPFQENKYVNLTEDFLISLRDINSALKSLNSKIEAEHEDRSKFYENLLKNSIPGTQKFNDILWRASTLLPLQHTLNSQDSSLKKTLSEDELYLKNYLHQRHSFFSRHNPFISSLITVGAFGIIPSIIGCILFNKMNYLIPSIVCQGGFFSYIWAKESTSLNKKQKAFNVYESKKIQ